MLVAARQPVDELRHGVDLVAAELEVGNQRETVVDGRHGTVGEDRSYQRAGVHASSGVLRGSYVPNSGLLQESQCKRVRNLVFGGYGSL